MAYTKPYDYIQSPAPNERNDYFRIVDYVVVSHNKDHAAKYLSDLETVSITTKIRLLELLERSLLPTLTSFSFVQGIVGRGSIFDEQRVVSADSGINLIVFLDRVYSEREVVNKFLTPLSDLQEPSFGIDYIHYDVNSSDFRGI